ncbi:hypothetical protein [Isorropodon fossajaponicum symbiont]|uniref:hypothetical protein n=1 Tax=Isorropodon fossajaponicum symbiont TaxID=883811 RepID=UPI0019163651|nr:hypothetical protein [Isorropodon fossajaponicum symbiont]
MCPSRLNYCTKVDSKEDFWLKLKKPKEPIKPQIQTPEELINWLENLHGENIDIVVKTEIEHNEVTLFLDDKLELKEKLSNCHLSS